MFSLFFIYVRVYDNEVLKEPIAVQAESFAKTAIEAKISTLKVYRPKYLKVTSEQVGQKILNFLFFL